MDFIRKILLALSKYSILIGLIAVVLFLLQAYVPFLRYFFEEEGPTIVVENIPPGLGVTTKEIKLKVEDNKSGLELVRARLEQSRLNESLFSTKLPWGASAHEATIKLNAKELGLRKGNVRITVEAFDRSLKSNGAKYSFEIPIRFDVPSIEVLSLQHNGSLTGIEVVLFKVSGENVSKAGVMVGDKFYQAVPAKQFDPDLESVANLYIGFYAIPLDYNESSDKISLVAYNEVGNSSNATFYYHIRDQKFRKWEYQSSKATLAQHKLFSETLSNLKLRESFGQKKWRDVIKKPDGKDTSPRIGDLVLLKGAEGEVVKIRNQFLSYRQKVDVPITSVAEGYVIYAKDLGDELGWCLIMDHGVGFFSVFSGLSRVDVKEGDQLVQGTEIGRSGFINHLGDSGYLYTLSYRGTAIRTEELWDYTWVNDHILEKIRDIKRRFLVTTNLPPLEGESVKEEEKPAIITGLSDLPLKDKPKNVITDF